MCYGAKSGMYELAIQTIMTVIITADSSDHSGVPKRKLLLHQCMPGKMF